MGLLWRCWAMLSMSLRRCGLACGRRLKIYVMASASQPGSLTSLRTCRMALVHSLVPHWSRACQVSHLEITIISSTAKDKVSFFIPRICETSLWNRRALSWFLLEWGRSLMVFIKATMSFLFWIKDVSSTCSWKSVFSDVPVQKVKRGTLLTTLLDNGVLSVIRVFLLPKEILLGASSDRGNTPVYRTFKGFHQMDRLEQWRLLDLNLLK